MVTIYTITNENGKRHGILRLLRHDDPIWRQVPRRIQVLQRSRGENLRIFHIAKLLSSSQHPLLPQDRAAGRLIYGIDCSK